MTAVPDAMPSSVAVVTDELLAEFGGLFSRSVVAQVVLGAFNSLRGQVLDGALPEMLARLARTRLTALRLEMTD
jgi:hypothetical protein